MKNNKKRIYTEEIITVKYVTYAVAKRKPEKTQAYGDSNWLKRCTGIAEVRVRSLASLNFFRLSFRNCISCLYNCDDLLCIYFFILQFKYMKFT